MDNKNNNKNNNKAQTNSGNNAAAAEQAETKLTFRDYCGKCRDFCNKYKKPVGKVVSYIIPAAILIYVMAMVIYFITSAYRAEFHSDCTDTILWANASIEGGAVYDKDFGYACFLPFGINLIMQPLINIFGLTMKAHIIGMMSYFVLLVVFFCLMLKEMHWDIRGICIACAVFLSMTLSSSKLREIFWQHTIYYSLGILFIVIGLFLYFHMLNLSEKIKSLDPMEKKRKRTFLWMIITFLILEVFIMFTATDGISALSIFAIPFIAGLFAEFFADPSNNIRNRRCIRTIAVIGVSGVMILLGMKLNKHWVGDLSAGYQDAYSTFSPMGSWVENLLKLPIAWLRLNGVQDSAYQTNSKGTGILLSNIEGVTNLLYILAAVLVAVIPVIATCFYQKYKESKGGHMLRIFVWMHWACTGIVLMGYIFGNLSGADWRLTPILGTSLILSTLFVHWAVTSGSSAQRLAVLLTIPVLMVSMMNLKAVKKIEKDYHKANNLYGIADFLEDEGMTYGYSTFWQANAITLITDSKIKVRDVDINENGVSARYYQSSKAWYKKQPYDKEYFLLLNPSEYEMIQTGSSTLLENAKRETSRFINNTEYHLLVFDYNFVYAS